MEEVKTVIRDMKNNKYVGGKIPIQILTLYFPMFPFDSPENIRKPFVFWCFQGDQKGTLGSKGLKESEFSFET